MILVLGHKGNMGQRYTTILDHLQQEWMGLDVANGPLEKGTISEAMERCDGCIVATPTDAHVSNLLALVDSHKPVLCEKPICKDLDTLELVLRLYNERKTPLTMVLQYEELLNKFSKGISYYNYFRTGKDGLYWDCVQIIGLANDEVEVKNTSPIWKCQINGQWLSIQDMDRAYINNVQRFLSGEYMNLKRIYEIHERVTKYAEAYESSNRDSGEIHLRQISQ